MSIAARKDKLVSLFVQSEFTFIPGQRHGLTSQGACNRHMEEDGKERIFTVLLTEKR